MPAKSNWPCEVIIYSKCFWKPCLLLIMLSTVLVFVYTILLPMEKTSQNVDVVFFEQKFIPKEKHSDPLVKVEADIPVDNGASDNVAYQGVSDNVEHLEINDHFIPTTKEPSTTSITLRQKINKGKKFQKKPKKEILHKKPPSFQWCADGDEQVSDVDCRSLFAGEENAIEKFKDWKPSCELTDYQLEHLSENCSAFRDRIPFEFDFEFPAETRQYPLAFILVVEKNADQVIRLLQSIYRSENLYCITYDAHSRDDFKRAMNNMANCYDNIIMPEHHHPINWGGFSILEANVNCLKLLTDHSNKWRYVQMLSWNDYPLKTNEEMVEIFKILNGSNDSELKDGEPYRYIKYYVEDHTDNLRDALNKPVPPGDLYIFKGSLASSLSRDFVQFVFDNEISQQFYNYSKSMFIPEEQYWSTLIHNLHIHPPGGFPGICKHYFWYRQKRKKPWISRYQMWKELKDPCEGQWTHKSCVFGVGDLWSMKPRPELVAHKIYSDFQTATAYCLSQLNFNRTYFGRSDDDQLNYHFYRELPSVKYQNLEDKSKFNCIG